MLIYQKPMQDKQKYQQESSKNLPKIWTLISQKIMLILSFMLLVKVTDTWGFNRWRCQTDMVTFVFTASERRAQSRTEMVSKMGGKCDSKQQCFLFEDLSIHKRRIKLIQVLFENITSGIHEAHWDRSLNLWRREKALKDYFLFCYELSLCWWIEGWICFNINI